MRARTHAAACDYALSDACTCGVSPAGLSTEQVIRMAALDAAAHQKHLGGSNWQAETLRMARIFEAYIRGESP